MIPKWTLLPENDGVSGIGVHRIVDERGYTVLLSYGTTKTSRATAPSGETVYTANEFRTTHEVIRDLMNAAVKLPLTSTKAEVDPAAQTLTPAITAAARGEGAYLIYPGKNLFLITPGAEPMNRVTGPARRQFFGEPE